jgi:phosphatidylglycerophosphatase A
MPGTFGTLVGLPVSLAINRLEQAYPLLGVGALVGLAIVAIVIAGHAARLLNAKDPQIVVIDEIAGFALANFLSDTATAIVGAFVLFRLFDIAKVYPERRLERLPGGAGIVLDDLLAGLYVFVIVRLLSWAGLL